MKFFLPLLVVLISSSSFTLSAPVNGNELKANNFDVFSLLGHLTNGTSISNVMTVLSLLNNVHQIQGDLQAMPNDIVNALNQLSSLVGISVANVTAILTGAGAKPKNNNFDVFSLLGHLTNGTSISQAMTVLSLLNNIHQLQGNIQALPNDLVNAINQLSNLVGVTAANLTSILTGALKPRNNNFDVFSLLGHLTNGTSISQVMTVLSLLNNVHHLQGDLQALPNDVVNAINQLSSLIGVTAANITSILTGNKPQKRNNLDVFGLLSHLTNGTNLSQVMTILSLLNNVHNLQGDLQALPNDVVNAINQLSSLIGVTAANLTSILTGSGVRPTQL